jgi:hypothetical protein
MEEVRAHRSHTIPLIAIFIIKEHRVGDDPRRNTGPRLARWFLGRNTTIGQCFGNLFRFITISNRSRRSEYAQLKKHSSIRAMPLRRYAGAWNPEIIVVLSLRLWKRIEDIFGNHGIGEGHPASREFSYSWWHPKIENKIIELKL